MSRSGWSKLIGWGKTQMLLVPFMLVVGTLVVVVSLLQWLTRRQRRGRWRIVYGLGLYDVAAYDGTRAELERIAGQLAAASPQLVMFELPSASDRV